MFWGDFMYRQTWLKLRRSTAAGAVAVAVLAGALATHSAGARGEVASPTAKIDDGELVGVREGNIVSFKGIPYAEPPVGPLRWQPPERPTPWNARRDANAFGAICPQPALPAAAAGQGIRGGTGKQSEDCLTLNVWAPSGAKNLPVMVWIHGGAHVFGSSSQKFYDGAYFAKDGIVFVSINYRLGALGYFAHPALTAEAAPDAPIGNYGMMDQIAALEWVQHNIGVFGGDPKNVTVFGESAGGASTLFLLTVPKARGLFQKAIVESGGGWTLPMSLQAKENLGVQAISDAGFDGAKATAADLRGIPAEKLIAPPKGPGFGPFVDGRLVTESPTKAFAQGRAANLPLIIGTNSNEGSVMDIFKLKPAVVFAAFPPETQAEMRKLYANDAKDDDTLAHRLYTDGVFGAAARWVARTDVAHGASAWLYYFSYVPELQRGKVVGARHGAEIPFVFETWDKIPLASLFVSEKDKAMAARMHACWVAFARTGEPGNCAGPHWPSVTPTSDATMEFGEDVAVRSNLRKAQLDFQQIHTKLLQDENR